MFDNNYDHEPDAWVECSGCTRRVPSDEIDPMLLCENCISDAEQFVYEQLFGDNRGSL